MKTAEDILYESLVHDTLMDVIETANYMPYVDERLETAESYAAGEVTLKEETDIFGNPIQANIEYNNSIKALANESLINR